MRTKSIASVRYVLIGLVFLAGYAEAASPSTTSQVARRTPVVDVFEATRDAVVNIGATRIIERRSAFDDLFFNWYGRGRTRKYTLTSVGSGFIIHPHGYVVTNAHVVANAADQKVVFADETEYPAKRVAVDEQHDLAILKIESDQAFHAIHLGRSHNLMIGETVVAIGNPLGYQHTVTAGIISATERELQTKQNVIYKDLIQTDTSINPGNSGGPLLNVLSELIGINTAIRGDAQNIGFAIPVDTLRKLLPELLSIGHHRRLAVGIQLSWREPKLVVEASGPAAKAGIEAGDELIRFDGKPVTQDIDFYVHLLEMKPDHELQLDLRRKGQHYTARFRPEVIPMPDGKELLSRKFGLQVRLLKPAEARRLDIRGGLYVTDVERGSPADQVGVERGMVVIQMGNYFPTDFDGVGAILEKVRRGEEVFFRFFAFTRLGIDVLGGPLVAR